MTEEMLRQGRKVLTDKEIAAGCKKNTERRKILKMGGFAALATFLGAPLIGCDRSKIIKWADIVVSAFEQALPIFKDILPASVAVLMVALQVAKDLREALKNASANTVDLIQQLIAPDGLFNKLIADVGLVTDAAQRKILSGILLLAGIALRLISAGLDQGTGQVPAGPAIKAKARQRNKTAVAAIEKLAKSEGLEQLLKSSRF